MYVYIYIYIHIERERERGRAIDRQTDRQTDRSIEGRGGPRRLEPRQPRDAQEGPGKLSGLLYKVVTGYLVYSIRELFSYLVIWFTL